MTLRPEEIFFRAFRQAEFDICELSMSSFTVKTAQGNCPYVGVPAFVSRAFRHTAIYVRTDRIKKPGDLKGKKVGVPEYQLTANVWARAILRGRSRREAVRHTLGRGGWRKRTGRKRSASRCRRTCSSMTRRRESTMSSMLRGRRDRWIYRPARPAGLCRRPPASRLAVSRSGCGGQGLFQAHRHFSDHAFGRRAARACREASLAARGGVQGFRAGQEDGARTT